jgi:hypothetical protein
MKLLQYLCCNSYSESLKTQLLLLLFKVKKIMRKLFKKIYSKESFIVMHFSIENVQQI